MVVVDLRRTVDEQGGRARVQAVRDAERVARELRARLADPDAVGGFVPVEARFFVEEGGVVVRPAVEIAPAPAFDPERDLDLLATERVRRASAATSADEALAELEPLLDDPSLMPRARTWIRARMAWIAHRGELTERRDALRTAGPGDLSLLLLGATTGALNGDALATAFAEIATGIDPVDGRALCDHLADFGVATGELRQTIDVIEARRTVLRIARTHEAELLATREPIVRAVSTGILLYWPTIASGAVLDTDAAQTVGRAAIGALDPPPTLVTAPFPGATIPVVDGSLGVQPAAVTAVGLLAGPTGTALLVAALALVCGGGTLLAFRSLRREAEALRLRTEFLTTVTHELKTPLAGVRLVAELLIDDHVRDEAERRDWLRRLNGEAARLGVLIENVLDLGRLDRGERTHAVERTDIAELVTEILALFAPLAEREGFVLRLSVPDRPAWADVDRDALRQALVNVLDNARKYGASPLQVLVRTSADAVEIVVRDHGAGVPATERATIFDRFRRGAAHGHGSIPGVGIGLHLARAIAVRHGGSLDCVDPPDDQGAQFEFRIPHSEGSPS